MKTVRLSRRQMLRGAGGISLGLPLLPSVLPSKAFGNVKVEVPPSFAAFATVHGGVRESNFQPASSLLTERQDLYPGHQIRWGELKVNGNKISEVLRGDGLTPELVKKINVLWGFDLPFYMGHHSGGHLGNYVDSDQGPKGLPQWVTADQFLAYSPKFYKDSDGVRVRSMHYGRGGFQTGITHTYANPSARTGVQRTRQQGIGAMFSQMFAGGVPDNKPEPAEQRAPIVDGILDSYKRLRNGNRRLSADDRERLDDHIGRLDELERTLTAKPDIACEANAPRGESIRAGNDLVALAFACGVSRVATVSMSGPDHNAAHAHNQGVLVPWNQRDFDGGFLDLVKKLDAIEVAPGQTLLDSSLVQWTNEAGHKTHNAQAMTVVAAGSANGFFKTGMYVDYRSKSNNAHLRPFGGAQGEFLGLQNRQWLANILLAMGQDPSDFEKNGQPGYGDAHMHASYRPAVAAGVISDASKPLPVITSA